jgi:hypothetical protein
MRDHGYAFNFLLIVKIIQLTLSKTFSASFSGTFLYKQLSLMSEIGLKTLLRNHLKIFKYSEVD